MNSVCKTHIYLYRYYLSLPMLLPFYYMYHYFLSLSALLFSILIYIIIFHYVYRRLSLFIIIYNYIHYPYLSIFYPTFPSYYLIYVYFHFWNKIE